MKSIFFEAVGIERKLLEVGVPRTEVVPIQSKGLGGEVIASAALVSLAAGTIAAITKVVVELLKKQKSFSIKIEGKVVDFSATNLTPEEVENLLAKFL